MSQLLYKIALTKIPKVGPVLVRELVSHAGSPQAVFELKRKQLMKIPGIGQSAAHAVLHSKALEEAEKELKYVRANGIRVLFYLDSDYPSRLTRIRDAPIVLYYIGTTDLNAKRILAVVGTRKPSEYGLAVLQHLLGDLCKMDVLIVSGLAYGVDIAAHRGALQVKMDTVAVMGSGLDHIYPAQHRGCAKKMITQGGLLTEFGRGSKPDREHFPMRNRIIAGMCDALLVVESDIRGGSMISADLANGYHKDVFAFPGRITDRCSKGTNLLIKSHRAHLLESAKELCEFMKWEELSNPDENPQIPLFSELTPEESIIMAHFESQDPVSIDLLHRNATWTPSELANHLLNLEFKGMI
nr:DNA-processing protein DprA [Saprospiraceae bacterium]